MICKNGHRGKKKGERCKICHREQISKHGKTFKGCLSVRWRGLLNRSTRKGWVPPDFTREEFFEFSLNCPEYKRLFDAWKKSGSKWDAPSVDRIDPELPYTLKNIRWVSWWDNWQKGNEEQFREIARLRGIDYDELMNQEETFEPPTEEELKRDEEFISILW